MDGFLNHRWGKNWRNREAEFDSNINTREELLATWTKGWDCLLNALDSIKPEDWEKDIYIRAERHSVMEAINRQLAHYPYHVGQIVFIGKMLAGDHWVSLSIPKGKSSEFNAEKFGHQKSSA